MSQDHYAILGVAPAAPPAAVRAAYLALMREFHPDRNPSPAAAGRAQAIAAAYKVLGDFDSRQEYDWGQRRARAAAAAGSAQPQRGASAALVILVALGVSVAAAMMVQPGSRPTPGPERLPETELAQAIVPAARQAPPPHMPSPPPPIIADRAPVVMPPPPLEKVIRIPELYPPPEPIAVKKVAAKAAVATPVRTAAVEKQVARPRPVLAKMVKPPVPVPNAGAARSTDLAALDQFVLSFYGQSWRYADAPRRRALETSRTLYAVRRAACAAESCRRSEILRLQRDVSAIVGGGQPR